MERSPRNASGHKINDSSQTTPLVNQAVKDDGNSQKGNKWTSKFRRKWKTILEAVLLSLLLLLLWIAYAAVPTVFYVLEPVLQVTDKLSLFEFDI